MKPRRIASFDEEMQDSNSTINSTMINKRVRFDDDANVYHNASRGVLLPEDCEVLWYSAAEMKKMLETDVRETLKFYLKWVRQQQKIKKEQPEARDAEPSSSSSSSSSSPPSSSSSSVIDIGDTSCGEDCYSRGMELLSPQHEARTARSSLYRSLVLKQYMTLKKSMCGSHLADMLQQFAVKNSTWAVARALALAAKDAAEARHVYHDAFVTKDGAAQGFGICPRTGRVKHHGLGNHNPRTTTTTTQPRAKQHQRPGNKCLSSLAVMAVSMTI